MIELRLPENPTTGFRWQLMENAGAVCGVTSDEFEAPPGAPGAGGQHSWLIEATRPGDCVFELRYRRRWGEPPEPEQTFRVHIFVAGG
jgi:inhibitor of cysteine peptidase